MLGGNEKTIARSAEWGASNKSEHRLVGFVNQRRNIAWFDGLAADHLVSVAHGIVINVDKIAVFEALKAGENEFVGIATIDVAGGVSGNDEIADLAR